MAYEFDKLNKENLIELLLSKDKLLQSKDELIALLQEQLNLLRHQKFSSKSEKISEDPNDRLFDEPAPPANEAEIEAVDDEIALSGYSRKKEGTAKTGRKVLPESLPRENIYYDINHNDKMCSCGAELIELKDSILEQLEIIPAKLIVKRHIRKNYGCNKCNECFKSAPMPAQVIQKSIASPSLLAHILVSKYQDHLPLYRLETIMQRIGIDIARATLCSWVIKASNVLKPLYKLLSKNINSYDIAYADETTMQVLKESERKAESKSYMWAFGGGSPQKFCYIYHYSESRSHEVPLQILSDFKGFLHSDGYGGYDALANKIEISLVACWYHCRRKFIEVQQATKKNTGLSGQFISLIKKLAKIEEECKDKKLNFQEIYKFRQVNSKPVIEKFKKLLDENIKTAPPKSLLGKAMKYADNQWPKLIKYLEDGRLEISNNLMERRIKPFVIGRKNWLFSDSVAGAEASAIIYSLIETCKEHNIEPYDWFKYVFTTLPTIDKNNEDEITKFLPYNFNKELLGNSNPVDN